MSFVCRSQCLERRDLQFCLIPNWLGGDLGTLGMYTACLERGPGVRAGWLWGKCSALELGKSAYRAAARIVVPEPAHKLSWPRGKPKAIILRMHGHDGVMRIITIPKSCDSSFSAYHLKVPFLACVLLESRKNMEACESSRCFEQPAKVDQRDGHTRSRPTCCKVLQTQRSRGPLIG